MQSIKINKFIYYQYNDLVKQYPSIGKGCSNSPGRFINKHSLDHPNFVYARSKKNSWVVTEGTSRKFDKVFIRVKWFKTNFPQEALNEEADNNIDEAPEIIELEDHEKFFDNDGNVVDIEVRGEREVNKCYFKVKDIADGFGIKRLQDVITNKNKDGYKYDVHYSYFKIPTQNALHFTKKLFLTYKGLLRVLFASYKKTTDKFVDWATKILFTSQLGTPKQKQTLASDLLNINPKTLKQILNKSSQKIPCIYFFTLGTVKQNRKKYNISEDFNDNELFGKFGLTTDFERRVGEHMKNFSKEIQLEIFEFIDPQYLSRAETKLNHLFEAMDCKIDSKTELVAFPKQKLKHIKEHYATICSAYVGNLSGIKHTYDRKLMEEIHKRELLEKDNELLKKDNELLKKDNELLKLKLKIAEQ